MPLIIQSINKHIYIRYTCIHTQIYQQINVLHYKYNYISTNQRPSLKIQLHINKTTTCIYKQKESMRDILLKIKGFSNFKGFHNEHGYISYFNFMFCFHKFNKFGHIQSFPIIWFNICFSICMFRYIMLCVC